MLFVSVTNSVGSSLLFSSFYGGFVKLLDFSLFYSNFHTYVLV